MFPVILFGMDTTSEAHDQNRHHLIVIREGADAIAGRNGAPTLGAFIQDYPSATSPGYHLVLSVAQNCGLGNLTLLRMGSSLFGLALLLTLWRLLCERVDGWLAVALALPLLFSPYYLSGCMWLTTDVAALWFVVLAIGSLLRPLPVKPHCGRAGVFAALAVLIRQQTVWLLAPLAVAGWMNLRKVALAPTRRGDLWVLLGALALPMTVMAWLIVQWGGIMPPRYRSIHDAGANGATIAFALGLAALWGVPWVWGLHGFTLPFTQRVRARTLAALLVALVFITCWKTDFNRSEGRWGGALWNAVQLAPTVAGRSLLLLPLALLGVVVLRALMLRTDPSTHARDRGVFIAAFVALLSALAVNSQCWERYIDLPLLALLPLAVALGVDRSDERQRRRLIVASIALGVAQCGLSVWGVYKPTFFGLPLS